MIHTGKQIETRVRVKLPRVERRGNIRIPLGIPVKVIVGTIAYDGFCTDISDGGLSFHTTAELDISKTVEVEFLQEGCRLRGKVSLLYRMGVRYGGYFSDLE
jgi:PilZ domain-containing protein